METLCTCKINQPHFSRFHDLDGIGDIHAFARQAIDTLLDQQFANAHPQDRVGMQINHPGLNTPILIPFRAREQLNADTIVEHIEAVEQSDTDFSLDEQVEFKFTTVRSVRGSGWDDEGLIVHIYYALMFS